MNKYSNRHEGIELGRIIAAFFVVHIHTIHDKSGMVSHLLGLLSLFAVPYFFVISAYLLSQKVKIKESRDYYIYRFIARISLLSLIWFLVYSTIPSNWLTSLFREEFLANVSTTITIASNKLHNSPLNYVFDGPPGGFHLWFMPSLILTVVLFWLFSSLKMNNLLLLIAITLFIVGLLLGAYQNTPIGFSVNFNTRNGPFYSLLLFYFGWSFGQSHKVPDAKWAYIFLLLGILINIFEKMWLSNYSSPLPEFAGYSASVLPLGISSFLLFFNIRFLLLRKHILMLGSCTLYVYLIHILLRTPIYSILGKVYSDHSQYIVLLLLYLVALLISVFMLNSSKTLRKVILSK